tara:strand:+ start:109 stop:261 length:153 start_codon:yes stop_codon:yes gene_type:complete
MWKPCVEIGKRELAWNKKVIKRSAKFRVGAAREREACLIQERADVLSERA